MKFAPLSTIFVAGLMVFGCAPADPVGGDGTGGRPAGSGGSSLATGGNNASGGTTSSGGTTGSGGMTSTGGNSAGTGGLSSSGGATGSGGVTSGTGGRGDGSGGRMGMGTGGGGPTGGGPGTGTSFAAVAAILGTSCGTGMCHTGTAHVDLRNMGDLRGRLVGGMPNGAMTMAMCKTKTLVVAGDPTTSVLSQVIKGKVTGCTNARMPDNCPSAMRPCLTMPQIATIDAWIMGGAGP